MPLPPMNQQLPEMRAREGPTSGLTDLSGASGHTFASDVPQVQLSPGGGALRGMGERFSTDVATGRGSMTVPIAVSPGRGGFNPKLTLRYDSGNGNGPFGMGWTLSLPQISRQTDKGVPRYLDAQESDVFLLSGADDLVPADAPDTTRTLEGVAYQVRRYRPRIEGVFACIERFSRSDGLFDVFWRSIDKNNTTTWYGKSAQSRIADPSDPTHVFAWLGCESTDDKGQTIVYEHVGEDDAGVDRADPAESRPHTAANRYLKRIRYGNRQSRLLGPIDAATGFLFELVFDYGEDHLRPLSASAAGHARAQAARDPLVDGQRWALRGDAFSHRRAGFEIRTRRLCRRVLMFHLFDPSTLEQPPPRPEASHPTGCLVTTTEFSHTQEEHTGLSLLQSVAHCGFRWQPDEVAYWKDSLPPLTFAYSQARLSGQVCELDAASQEHLPQGLDGRRFQWVDLDGEGLSGILARDGRAWRYKPNLSALNPAAGTGTPFFTAAFGPSQDVAAIPATAGSTAQWHDVAGDGYLNLVDFSGPLPGFYRRGSQDEWAPFVTFDALPRLDWNSPDLRFVDLVGDGRADLLVHHNGAFHWHPSLGEAGFGASEPVCLGTDGGAGPRLVFEDDQDSLHLADMTGDGLADLVRIRNGAVCYWPNLGHGRFGAPVTMRDSPWFDTPDLFDLRRIRLADVDGSGCTDIVYLAADGPRLYFNRTGSGWTPAVRLAGFPPIDNLASVAVVDLFGAGTACLVWSSPLAGDAGRALRYVDLMGGTKPHLLTRSDNHLGAETCVHYLPSTHFFLRDKQVGRPWTTRLPFPVQVVAGVETRDLIAGNRYGTRYAYHHGHYDGVEREFCGFGMVEQWDTDRIPALAGGVALPEAAPWQYLPATTQLPTVYTKTWFHTGAAAPGLEDRAVAAWQLPDTALPDGLDADATREARRALKGRLLLQEVYGLDSTHRAPHPYTIAMQNYGVVCVEPRGKRRHGVYMAHQRESVSAQCERDLHCAPGTSDPRIAHTMTLAIDAFGNVTASVAIAYGRRGSDVGEVGARLQPDDHQRQRTAQITLTESSFTIPVTRDDAHRTPLPAQTSTWEMRRPVAESGHDDPSPLYRLDDMRRWAAQAADGAHDVPCEDLAFETAARALQADPAQAASFFRRLIARDRTLYRPDDCGARAGDAEVLLPLYQMEPRALVGETYRLALTQDLFTQVFCRRAAAGGPEPALLDAPAAVLCDKGPAGGGYVDLDGDACWWVPSGRRFLSPRVDDDAAAELTWARAHFFMTSRHRDAFGQTTLVQFDEFDLLIAQTTDALGNTQSVLAHDHRVLQPRLLRDPNGNCTQIAFDLLGRVAGQAVMGKASDATGDSLDGFEPDPGPATVLALLADPLAFSQDLLGHATRRWVYDLSAFARSQHLTDPQPMVVAMLARETHETDVAALSPGAASRIQLQFVYSDGLGRQLQTKTQAEPVVSGPGGTAGRPRWLGSDWTAYDGKGQPVRRHAPFFSDTHRCEPGARQSVSTVRFHDPLGRVVATLHPDHRYEKWVVGPWRRLRFDANDTTLAPSAADAPPIDPRDDPDVGAYFQCLPAGDLLPTWHALRTDPAQSGAAALRWPDPRVRDAERRAATQAAAFAGTPTTEVLDPLGRPFLVWAHNRVACPGHADDGLDVQLATRTTFDIQGRVCAVRDAVAQAGDALGRTVARHDHDLLGQRLHQASMDAGARWTLADATGRAIRAWDSRGHAFTTAYDALRRPTARCVRGTRAESDPRTLHRDILFEKTEYGETQTDAQALNLRTRLYRQFDAAGVSTCAGLDPTTQRLQAYDIQGQLLRSTRQLASDHTALADWSQPVALDPEVFASSTRYDALERHIQTLAPRSSLGRGGFHVVQPVYGAGGLVCRVDVWLDRSAEPPGLLDPGTQARSPVGVLRIDHNAHGQRERVDLANGASTFSSYDPQTFRLVHLLTRRGASAFPDDDPQRPIDGWPGSQLQNLRYSHDADGNVTHILDDAQQTRWFRNQRVDPDSSYTYDALGRLVEATGREHLGQGGGAIAHAYNDAGRTGRCQASAGAGLAPNDGQAMGRYVERYGYDAVGNITEMQHRGGEALPGWTRHYAYADPSWLENGSPGTLAKTGNRLGATTLHAGGTGALRETYAHDNHGNLLCMPQLQSLQWGFGDRLRTSRRQRVNGDDVDGEAHHGDLSHYVYDAAGQRVRKVTALAGGHRVEERIYLGGFEVFRRHAGSIGAGSIRRERETLHVLDGAHRIALVESRTLDTTGTDPSPAQLVRYALGNHLGSASLELDSAAQIISYEEYTPFGSTSYQAVRSATEAAKRYRFTGKERDEETGLCYHGARYYAPWLGRWTSADPAGLVDGPNLYAYCNNSPVRLVDATGHSFSEMLDAWLAAPGELWREVKGYARGNVTEFREALGLSAPPSREPTPLVPTQAAPQALKPYVAPTQEDMDEAAERLALVAPVAKVPQRGGELRTIQVFESAADKADRQSRIESQQAKDIGKAVVKEAVSAAIVLGVVVVTTKAVAKVATTALEASIAESVQASTAASTTRAGTSVAKAVPESLAEVEAKSFAHQVAKMEYQRLREDLGWSMPRAARGAREFEQGLLDWIRSLPELTKAPVNLARVDALRLRPRPK